MVTGVFYLDYISSKRFVRAHIEALRKVPLFEGMENLWVDRYMHPAFRSDWKKYNDIVKSGGRPSFPKPTIKPATVAEMFNMAKSMTTPIITDAVMFFFIHMEPAFCLYLVPALSRNYTEGENDDNRGRNALVDPRRFTCFKSGPLITLCNQLVSGHNKMTLFQFVQQCRGEYMMS